MGPAIGAAAVLISGFMAPTISISAAFIMAGVTLALGAVSYALTPRPKKQNHCLNKRTARLLCSELAMLPELSYMGRLWYQAHFSMLDGMTPPMNISTLFSPWQGMKLMHWGMYILMT